MIYTSSIVFWLRREEERRDRLQRAREFEEAAWAEAAAAESGEEEAQEEVPDELYCLACDKLFRTPNAMANHNKCAHTKDGLYH